MKLFHLLGERTVFEFRYSITLPSLGLAEPPSLTGVGVSICCVLVGSKTLSINCYWPAIRQGETGPLEARASVASDAVGSGPVWDLHFRLPVLDLGLDLGLGRIPVHERWLSAGYQIDLLKYCAEGKSERFGVIKFAIINLPGRVIHHARQLVVRLTRNHPSNAILIAGRSRILQLACGPSG